LEERALASDEGTPVVRVFGRDVWDVFQLRARLGIVSADLHHRFVAGNNEGRITGEAAVLSGFLATHGILRHGVITAEMRGRATAALERMGVAHLAKRRLDAMSSGQARRVVLARALVTEPRALLLDEPTTGLDIAARFDFMERVREIARGGTTIILVTHHIEEIIPEIRRVLLMRDGRIAAEGPKSAMLTADRLSRLFDTPIALREADGYFQPSRAGSKAR
jgi:iron complex transport system ATP-binding protein